MQCAGVEDRVICTQAMRQVAINPGPCDHYVPINHVIVIIIQNEWWHV